MPLSLHSRHTVRVACHGRHPDRGRAPAACGMFLGWIAGPLRLVEVTQRAPDEPDGDVWLRCSRCKQWNHFEELAPSILTPERSV